MQNRLIKAAAAVMCACLVTGVLAVIPDSAQGAGKAAAIVTSAKRTMLKRAGSEEYEKLKVNTMLYEGDAVRVKRWGRAGLALTGGAEVRLKSNSYFKLTGSGVEKEQEVKLSLGRIWTKLLHKMAKVRVRTPTAVAAVRGTEADVEMRDIMTVKVYEGHVDLVNDQGTQSLTAGQMSQVAGADSAPSAPKAMQPGDYDTWQKKIKIENMDKFIQMLKAELGKPGEKTMEFDIQKGDKTKKLKIKLRKE